MSAKIEATHDNKFIQLKDKNENVFSVVLSYINSHPRTQELKQTINIINHLIGTAERQVFPIPLSNAVKEITSIAFFAGLRYAKLYPEKVGFFAQKDKEKEGKRT